MVTRSTCDFKQHKQDVYDKIKEKYGEMLADRFIKYYSDKYDKHNRSFISYKLAFWLLDDYYYVRNQGTKWYAIVGAGGSGKSTLAKNIFYYLDPSFNPKDRLAWTCDEFVSIIDKWEKVGSFKAAYMDEPDDTVHPNSHSGKILKSILGKGRQMQAFFGICATDIVDIPLYIFRKLDGIFYTPFKGKAMLFKNRPKKKSYVIQDIRRDYTKMGYRVFYRYAKSAGCLRFDTSAKIPFSAAEEKEYLKVKEEDFNKTIKDYIKLNACSKENNPHGLDRRGLQIIEEYKKGTKVKDMAVMFGIQSPSISERLTKYRRKGLIT